MDRLLVSKYVPASLVVNQDLEIVQTRGKTGPYLEPAPGHPTFSLSKMAREGLLIDLGDALGKAKKDNAPVRKEGVRVQSNGGIRDVTLEVMPMTGMGAADRHYLIVFQGGPPAPAQAALRKGQRDKGSRAESLAVQENARLKRELSQLRQQMQSVIEEQETTLEETKTVNEEVLSTNEELQSTNEELETAKEELQSSNEELTTVGADGMAKSFNTGATGPAWR